MRHLLAVFVLGLALLSGSVASAMETRAKQAILIDMDTRTVLFEKNSRERMPTSSMSKVLTAYMAFEALKEKRISLETPMTVSEKAWRIQGSKMFVPLGGQVSVHDLLQGIIVQSGNDACVVLAEGIAGSEEAFANMMNKKALALGMKESHFMNASGWPDPNHYSTAYDLALLAYHLIKDYPEYYHYYGQKEYSYNGIKQGNRNPLLYRNIGADGLKTGHTENAGYGLIGTAIQNGRRLILVVNGLENMQQRADESASLLSWGFTHFQYLDLFKKDETVETAKVWMGVKKSVPAVAHDDVKTLYKIDERDKVSVTAVINEPLAAPVVKGAEIGALKIKVGAFPERSIPLYAGEDVAELGLFPRMIERAKLMLAGE